MIRRLSLDQCIKIAERLEKPLCEIMFILSYISTPKSINRKGRVVLANALYINRIISRTQAAKFIGADLDDLHCIFEIYGLSDTF